jgi:hypothetical protein
MFKMFFDGNPFRQAAKDAAKVSLFLGLFLIGFGMLVFVLRDLFAFIAAAIFFMAGFSAIGYALRLFILQWKMRKAKGVYREGVEVHFEDEKH